MNRDMDSDWLIIIFEDQLHMAMIVGESPESFTIRGIKYSETGHGDLTAFYDRLEDRLGKMVGIRVYAARETEQFLHAVPAASYVNRFSEEAIIDVYFASRAKEEITSTGDQAFGGKWFIGTGGRIALSVDFTYLALGEDDWLALEEAEAEWVAVA